MFPKQGHIFVMGKGPKGARGGENLIPVFGELLHLDCLFIGYDCVRPLQYLPVNFIGLGHIVQSKLLALLVPPTCTNGHKNGTT